VYVLANLLFPGMCRQQVPLAARWRGRLRKSQSDSEPSRSRLVASALAGAWRTVPAPLDISPKELDTIKPLLLQSGAAALVWWRARVSGLKDTQTAANLREAYRFQTIQAAIREREISFLFAKLAEAGVEPILVKGWAIARHYPEIGLRPQGDIDIVVRPKHLAAARWVLSGPTFEAYEVDLDHREFANLKAARLNEIYGRSRVVELGDVPIRVLSPEDHLAFLCLHNLRHGAWRPLWFCDIAAALEGRPADFDWDLCLRSRRNRASVTAAVGLAHHLMGARIDDTPFAVAAKRLPGWLIREVLAQWLVSDPMAHPPFSYRAPMASYFRNPAGALKDLVARWPNPIEATASIGGPFNGLPRLPFQLGNCAARTARFISGALRPTARQASE
jgi:hypothetical protein